MSCELINMSSVNINNKFVHVLRSPGLMPEFGVAHFVS
jgi:hypothetical protein